MWRVGLPAESCFFSIRRECIESEKDFQCHLYWERKSSPQVRVNAPVDSFYGAFHVYFSETDKCKWNHICVHPSIFFFCSGASCTAHIKVYWHCSTLPLSPRSFSLFQLQQKNISTHQHFLRRCFSSQYFTADGEGVGVTLLFRGSLHHSPLAVYLFDLFLPQIFEIPFDPTLKTGIGSGFVLTAAKVPRFDVESAVVGVQLILKSLKELWKFPTARLNLGEEEEEARRWHVLSKSWLSLRKERTTSDSYWR